MFSQKWTAAAQQIRKPIIDLWGFHLGQKMNCGYGSHLIRTISGLYERPDFVFVNIITRVG
jgi:hypothetical protein